MNFLTKAGEGGRGLEEVNFFHKESKSKKIFFEGVGGGGGA